MNFGDAWEGFMGKCEKSTAHAILDHFYDSGGNFLDTYDDFSLQLIMSDT